MDAYMSSLGFMDQSCFLEHNNKLPNATDNI